MIKRYVAPFVGVWLVSVTGCQLAGNPFRGVAGAEGRHITPTSAKVLGYEGQVAVAPRDFEDMKRATASGAVIHRGLYFEVLGETDPRSPGNFSWTWRDYSYFARDGAGVLVKTLLLPVTLCLQPPGAVMESNGTASQRWWGTWHDARRVEPRFRL